MLPRAKNHSRLGAGAMVTLVMIALICGHVDGKEFKKDQIQKGQNLCIARFESTTGEPLYYTCPKPNESEKKSYCCYLDKCCDYKEFQKQTEQQYKMSTANGSLGYMSKHAIGGVLKFLLWIVFFFILLIVGCCCLVFLLCRKKKLFSDGIFNTPLPAQPPGPNIYTRPNQPYEWPETLQQNPPQNPQPYPQQPMMMPPSYPAYPSQSINQPPYNPMYLGAAQVDKTNN